MGTSSPIGRTVHSLYWRIVLSFAACIATVLAVQVAAVQIWMKSTPDTQQLRAFTRQVAADVGRAMSENPNLDPQQYVDAHYPKPLASIFGVQAKNGLPILRGPLRPGDAAIESGREFFRDNPHPPALPDSWLMAFHANPI